jgi:hypothetical protein
MVAGPTILKIVCVVAILLLAAPLAAEGQKTGKVYRSGVLDPKPVALNVANLDAFRQGMREFQYAEGQNFGSSTDRPRAGPPVSPTWHMSWFARRLI